MSWCERCVSCERGPHTIAFTVASQRSSHPPTRKLPNLNVQATYTHNTSTPTQRNTQHTSYTAHIIHSTHIHTRETEVVNVFVDVCTSAATISELSKLRNPRSTNFVDRKIEVSKKIVDLLKLTLPPTISYRIRSRQVYPGNSNTYQTPNRKPTPFFLRFLLL